MGISVHLLQHNRASPLSAQAAAIRHGGRCATTAIRIPQSRVLELKLKSLGYTLPKANIAPEHGWFEDEIPFKKGLLSGPMLVSGRVLGGD